MNKSYIFFIIPQIYIVRSFITSKNIRWLGVGAWFWMILAFIAWGVG